VRRPLVGDGVGTERVPSRPREAPALDKRTRSGPDAHMNLAVTAEHTMLLSFASLSVLQLLPIDDDTPSPDTISASSHCETVEAVLCQSRKEQVAVATTATTVAEFTCMLAVVRFRGTCTRPLPTPHHDW